MSVSALGKRTMVAIGRAICALASEQFGVVTREQLLVHGVSASWIDRRIASGYLHPILPGVYAVGRRDLPPRGRWLAGVLAGGEGAALSHRSAGSLSDLLAWTGFIEITAPRQLRPRPGFRPHHATLPADELTGIDGIAVTTVPRTLLDLAAVLPYERLESAVNRAEMLELGGRPSARDLIARYPGRRGVRRLRSVLDRLDRGMAVTRSELEERFRRFIARSALPNPEFNAAIEVNGNWYVVDCLWRQFGLAVELDGFQWHGTRKAFQSDRARDRALLAIGLRTARVTWSDLNKPAALEAELGAMLNT
jgi:very-short-patch-repair endonuclease